MIKQQRTDFIIKLIKKIGVLFFWLVIWQLVFLLVNNKLLISSPYDVLKTIISLIQTSDLWVDIFSSIFKIMSGFLFAVFIGVCLAVLSFFMPFLYTLLSPIISVIKATPVASFIILALIWIKTDYISSFTAFLMVLPIIYRNTYTGIELTDKKLLEMSGIYNFNNFRKIKYIYLPSILPHFLSAVSISIGFAWKSGVAAEVLGIATHSIGINLYEAKVYLETENLFAWTIIIILISVLFESLITYLIEKINYKI